MTVGIRTKLIALLTLVALLPLVAGLLIIVVGGRSLRRDTVAQGLLAVALSEGKALQVSLAKDIEKLDIVLHTRMVLDELSARTRPLSKDQVARLDAAWPGLDKTDRRVRTVLKNPIADVLHVIRLEDPRLAELLVTDRFGNLVAATEKTSDFYQGDEKWWLDTHENGKFHAIITPVSFDASAHTWSIDIGIPVRKDGKFIGVAKAVLTVSGWVGGSTRSANKMSATMMLICSDGRIIYGRGGTPLALRVSHWSGPIAQPGGKGWRVSANGRIQAFVSVALPEHIGRLSVRTPSWKLIVGMPESVALAGVYRLSMWVLLVGLCLIGLIFLVGLGLVERSVIRRIRLLESATHSVAEGDLAHRIDVRWSGRHILGEDEIDDLADDFNRMVAQVQRSHQELQDANALRTAFIRIAGHELRTPVSYILATARLLKDNSDPDRLARAVRSMGEKAQRLNEIIQAMFKLMPEHGRLESLRYDDVDMAQLLEEVYLTCKPFADERGQRLMIDTGAGRVAIRGDRAKLADIFENLLMNAVKFTPDGGRIDLSLSRVIGDYISITVRDQGPGIPPAEQEKIFEPFYSGGDVMKHSSGRAGYQKRGAGLGLTIVRYFVHLHGGTVRVTSGPQGAAFTVTLPVSAPGASPERSARWFTSPRPAANAESEEG